MELGLSLGNTQNGGAFCSRSTAQIKLHHRVEDDHDNHNQKKGGASSSSSEDPTAQIHLLPFSPLPLPRHPLRFPWLPNNLSCEPGSSDGVRRRAAEEAEEQSSPNSGTSSFKEFSLYNNKGGEQNKNNAGEVVMMMGLGVSSRGHGSDHDHDDDDGYDDDDDQNIGLISSSSSSTRKKLRLSKEQSAFLEESFKDHHTLNPKQKVALAKQLNLRPRQVEVWFQNRRARTKLKQTEVDCEYLKRCCETLTEDNKRLQKELMELRSLKSSQPFFMHLPPTTLTMCPSCERVAPTSTTSYVPNKPASSSSTALSLGNNNNNVNVQAHRTAS